MPETLRTAAAVAAMLEDGGETAFFSSTGRILDGLALEHGATWRISAI
jgi:hypothetical protein